MDRTERFTFNLPVFMLAVKDKPGQFVAYSERGKNMALVFTSVASAQAQVAALGQGDSLAIASIETPADLQLFMDTAIASKHGHVVFDLDPQTMKGFVFSMEDMLQQIAGQMPKERE